MNVYQMKCPNCNGNLDVNYDEGLDFVFCKYCGNKCAIDYGAMEHQINYSKRLKSEETRLDKRYKHEERALEMKYEDKKGNRTMTIVLVTMAMIITLVAVVGIIYLGLNFI